MKAIFDSTPGSRPSERRVEPVIRRYRPEPAALDQLVEALYLLLMDVPDDSPGTAAASAEIGLPFGPARVRNVS